MRDAAGEIDHLDAARDLARGVGVGLAVLGRDRAGDLVGVPIEQLLEAEHVLARFSGGVAPQPASRLLGGGDGGVDLGGGRERQLGDLLAGRRIEHRRDAPRWRSVTLLPPMAFWMVCMAATPCLSIRVLQDAGKNVDELVDLLLLDDQRRRQRDDVAGGADQEPALEGLEEGVKARLVGSPGIGSSSMAPIRPMLRMSMTCGRPFSECSASSQ